MKNLVLGFILLAAFLAVAPATVAQDEGEGGSEDFLPKCALAHQEDEESTESATEESAELPEWQSIALTEVNSGEELALADLAGCTVIFEPMATWCINCFQQLTNVAGAQELLDPDEVAIVAMSVEVGLENDMLKAYSEESGFDFFFVVANSEMLQAIDAEFGRSALNPPATPHIYIAPDGTFSELHTGGESPEDIVAQVDTLTDADAK